MCRIVLRHHDDSGGTAVQSVDDSRSNRPPNPRKVGAMMEQGIDQRPARMAGRRMNHHTGFLVDRDQVPVLVENVEWDVLRNRVDIRRRRRIGDQKVSARCLSTRSDSLAVQMNEIGLDPATNLRPRYIAEFAQHDIDSLAVGLGTEFVPQFGSRIQFVVVRNVGRRIAHRHCSRIIRAGVGP